MALVLDTGVIYAALDEHDRDYKACAELIQHTSEQLILPGPVLVELDYWLRKMTTLDVWLASSEDVHSGAYVVWPVDSFLLLSAAQLQTRFPDQNLGFVDAAVFCTCEILGEPKVATLGHRPFGVLRTEGGRALDLLPG